MHRFSHDVDAEQSHEDWDNNCRVRLDSADLRVDDLAEPVDGLQVGWVLFLAHLMISLTFST